MTKLNDCQQRLDTVRKALKLEQEASVAQDSEIRSLRTEISRLRDHVRGLEEEIDDMERDW